MNAYNFNIIVLFALTDSFKAIENRFLSCCTAFDEEHLKFLKILDSGGLQDQITNGLELPFTVGNCQDCKVLDLKERSDCTAENRKAVDAQILLLYIIFRG